MWYWIIMFLLAAGCAGMLAVTFMSIKKQKAEKTASRRRGRRASGAAARGGDEEQEAPRRRPARQSRQTQNGQREQQGQQERRPKRKKKRQWKIILEDIDSWEKYSFVFYDAVGIGRDKEGKMYEKYLPLTEDKRISKAHCVILRRGEQLFLKDEGSRNGTYLNGERIEGPAPLQKDDIIGVGGTRLEVQRVLRESDQ